MARFLVINPNTSEEMTLAIKKTVKLYVHSHNEIDVVKSVMGPRSLETFYDYGLATIGVINTLQNMNIEKYDGILLACFGDPGLYALKEITPIPIIGIAESSLSMSLLLGSSFAIIVALEKAVPMMKNMVQQYALTGRMAGIYSLGISVLGLEENKKKTLNALLEVTKRAVSEKGAEVIILGCAGLTGFSDRIEKEIRVTVIDPVRIGIKILESIVESDLKIARNGLYMSPSLKEIVNMDFIKPLKNTY